jgi:predicted esterase
MNVENVECPATKFVVLGYSQGALAAHVALRALETSDP